MTIQQTPEWVTRFQADLSAFDASRIPGVVGIGRGIFSRTSQLERLRELAGPTLMESS
jgi:hypothetical protein